MLVAEISDSIQDNFSLNWRSALRVDDDSNSVGTAGTDFSKTATDEVGGGGVDVTLDADDGDEGSQKLS